ncbi:phage late control D family protein ['Paenibacillus yunnanensis' Narsing Rao et al. 2020]|uniref:phage late control D family protein n=1 Tax=Paenibacillus tengchongensis TaxID=2608684 RepID=UPI00124DE8B5|nr:contractile injection system protein, VgrG/Pvc8 family [Paenibacillus tengchongensis]
MSTSVANYKIELNGSKLAAGLTAAVEGVTLEDEINLPALFSIRLNMVDSGNGMWRGIDLKTLKPGDKVKLSLGLDKAVPLISGEITSLDLNFSEHSVLDIRGYDLLHRLRMGTRSKVFLKKKDSEIAAEIAKEHGLSPVVDDTATVHPYLFQNNQSNYEFLLERAALLDYELYADDKTMYFVKSRAQKAPTLPELSFKKDFERLNLELRTLTRGSKVKIRGWDVKEKKALEAEAKAGDETAKMGGKETGYAISAKGIEESPIAIMAENLLDMSEAKALASAAYNSRLRDFIAGEGMCWGNPQLRAGQTVKLLGMGERFSGIYYVVSTVHKLDSKGYTTTFRVKRTGL